MCIFKALLENIPETALRQLELHMTHIAVLWMRGEKSQSHGGVKEGNTGERSQNCETGQH